MRESGNCFSPEWSDMVWASSQVKTMPFTPKVDRLFQSSYRTALSLSAARPGCRSNRENRPAKLSVLCLAPGDREKPFGDVGFLTVFGAGSTDRAARRSVGEV